MNIDIDNKLLNIFTNTSINELNIKKYYELNQIHSDIINILDDNYINNTDGDAIITNQTNKPIIIKTADCIPILVYDKVNKVLALAHSGWKGTLSNITIKTINKMIDIYNSKKENIQVVIYPSIRQCHFEVDLDVFILFKNNINDINQYTIKQNNKYYIDMQSIIKDNLKQIGINNIIDTNICTYCNKDKYHSYRYNHTDKRNILLAMIKE